MQRGLSRRVGLMVSGSAWMSAAAIGGAGEPWVVFEEKTGELLVAPDEVGAGDTQQKDYAWGDLDNDGDTDLVVARKQPWTTPGKRANVLLMNEGGVLVDRTADFAAESDVPGDQGFLTPTNDRDIRLADLNGDGWLDVVTAVFSLSAGDSEPKHLSHPRVYINLGADGQGDWQGLRYEDARIPLLHPVADPRFYSVSAGDLDSDGDVDLFFSDGDNGGAETFDFNNRLLINDGAGFFTDETAARLTPEMANSTWGISSGIADFNGDGALDILKHSAVLPPVQVAILYNDPENPGFFTQTGVVTQGLSPTFVSIGDLNADGLPDIVQTDDGVDRYWLNDGAAESGLASFSQNLFQAGGGDDGFGGNSVVADLDGDGLDDVVITDVDFDIPGCNRRAHFYHNLGGSPGDPDEVELVEEPGSNPVGGIASSDLTGTHDIAVFDINGDGALDLVVGRCAGTSVYLGAPVLGASVSLITELPPAATPGEPLLMVFFVEVVGGEVDPFSGVLVASYDGQVVEAPIVPAQQPGAFQTLLPGGVCGQQVSVYAEFEISNGQVTKTVASEALMLNIADGLSVASDDLESGAIEWEASAGPGLTAGGWELAEPVATGFAPGDDGQEGAGGFAFVTQNGVAGGGDGAADVDGGPATLVSPPLEISGAPVEVSFRRWFASVNGTPDALTTSISSDGGVTWFVVDEIGGAGVVAPWETVVFRPSDFVPTPATIRVRWEVSDEPNDSFTEAGVDLLSVTKVQCMADCPGDVDLSGFVDSMDLNALLQFFGCTDGGCPVDLDGDEDTDSADLNVLLGAFGTACP